MVLLYHAGLPFVPGGFAGVDVFFVISGFLITGLIVRELERTGGLSLRTFWARRAKRLLPATALVLTGVTLLSMLMLPQLRWMVTAGDIASAALYVVNWRLAGQSVDYLAQNYAPSPVQHFWSLAVEEQFYLLWPVLVVGVAAAGRRFGWSLRRALLFGLAALAVPSLLWGVHVSGSESSAYFVTTTRVWELAIGAAVAVAADRLAALPVALARVLTWCGVLVLVGVTLFLPDTVAWPGSAALLPTLATAGVIAGGCVAGPSGATFLLSRAPMRRIGDLSYSLYLWHWPLLVFAGARWPGLSPVGGVLVVLLSFGPAALTYRFVERPLHRSPALSARPGRALALGAVCTVIGVAGGFSLRSAIPPVDAVAAAQRPGAAALITNPATAIAKNRADSITPDPLKARADLPELYGRGCQSNYDSAVPRPCVFGDPAAKVTVALVGDSRAAQWAPAVQEVARQEGWRVVTITKAGCAFADVDLAKGPVGHQQGYPSCVQWNLAVRTMLATGPYRPSFVVTSAFSPYIASVGGRALTGEQNRAALVAGFHRTWASLNRDHIPVVAIRETPLMSMDIAECVAQHRDSLSRCDRLRKRALRNAHILQPAAQGLPGTTVVDLTKAVCPMPHCPVVIGNVLIYRDNHHLTATYSRSLAPFLSDALAGLRRNHFADGALDAVLPQR
jgi:peptidoglycan/LPS O-acetylase OafA/YrhL